MSKIGVKQSNINRLDFNGFKSGLDYRSAPFDLPISALTRATNVEFDPETAILRKCDGIVPRYTAAGTVGSGFPFQGHQLFTVGQQLYHSDMSAATPTATLIGTITGTARPMYCLWNDECLIASGGQLNRLNSSYVLSIAAGSPNCTGVMMRESRIMVWAAGDDFLYFSAVGDPTTWDLSPQPQYEWESSADATTALFVEIGYQDGLSIVSAEVLASDLIFFKSDGTVHKTYRLKNQFPDWVVEEMTSVPALATKAALNDIFIIGKDGFRNVSTTQQYGDLAQYDAGRKINPALSYQAKDSNAKIWYVPSRNQMYVKLSDVKTAWMFHYAVSDGQEMGAWTVRTFKNELNDIWEDGNTVYLAYGSKVCIFSASVSTDDGDEFTSEIQSKEYHSRYFYNISRYIFDLENSRPGMGMLTIGNYSKSLEYGATGLVDNSDNDEAYSDFDEAYSDSKEAAYDNGEAYSDGDEAYSDDDPLFPVPVRYSKFIDTKCEKFNLNMTCTSGGFGFRFAGLDIAEV